MPIPARSTPVDMIEPSFEMPPVKFVMLKTEIP